MISTITYTYGRSVYLSSIGLYDLLWDQYHRNTFLWWRQSSQTCRQNFESTGMFRVQNHIVQFDKLSRLIHLMCRQPCSLHCNHTETSWGCSRLAHIWKRKGVTLISSPRPGSAVGEKAKQKGSDYYSTRFACRFFFAFYFSVKLPTYPSPKPTLTLSSYLRQNVGIGEG